MCQLLNIQCTSLTLSISLEIIKDMLRECKTKFSINVKFFYSRFTKNVTVQPSDRINQHCTG